MHAQKLKQERACFECNFTKNSGVDASSICFRISKIAHVSKAVSNRRRYRDKVMSRLPLSRGDITYPFPGGYKKRKASHRCPLNSAWRTGIPCLQTTERRTAFPRATDSEIQARDDLACILLPTGRLGILPRGDSSWKSTKRCSHQVIIVSSTSLLHRIDKLGCIHRL